MSTRSSDPQQPGAKKKRDLTKRTADFAQFDVLDGPCTRFFHLFVRRRMMTISAPRPYPFFIGGIQRLARMIDGGDPWELIVLGIAPLLFAAGLYHSQLGVPAKLGGFVIVFLGSYTGFWFVLLVFLDRRLDRLDKARVDMVRHNRTSGRDERTMRRRMVLNQGAEIAQRNAEALERGKLKARANGGAEEDAEEDDWDDEAPKRPVPVQTAPAPVEPSLDDLLK
jgi:hypothetical protein